MCAPTVNYTRQNYGTANEKLAFECSKSVIGATTNLHQQNSFMASGIIFVPLWYHLVFTISGIPRFMRLFVKYYWNSYS